jgi:hypothetical protein
MKVLTIGETIAKGKGHYWWRDWEDKADGGTAPAKCNLPAYCYLYDGEVYSLTVDEQRRMAGGNVDWEVEKASPALSAKLREVFPNK